MSSRRSAPPVASPAGAADGAARRSAGRAYRDDPVGRDVSVERNLGYGASARMGWVVDDRALLYAKAGVIGSEFETRYRTGGADLRQSDTQVGARLSGGVELPANDQLAVRLEYTHARYEDYQIDLPSGTDSFEPSENLFQAGVVWRF